MVTEPMQPEAPAFGPSALLTPANAVTIFRLLISPILLVMIASGRDSWPAVGFWIALASTDGVDGYLARRHGTTRSGAFLDPLADKVLVLGALLVLAAENIFGWIPVLLIGARELAMSLYRAQLGRRGIAVPARRSAKVKTVVQEVAIGFALLPLTASDATWVATSILWIGVALGFVSFVQYLLDGRKAWLE